MVGRAIPARGKRAKNFQPPIFVAPAGVGTLLFAAPPIPGDGPNYFSLAGSVLLVLLTLAALIYVGFRLLAGVRELRMKETEEERAFLEEAESGVDPGFAAFPMGSPAEVAPARAGAFEARSSQPLTVAPLVDDKRTGLTVEELARRLDGLRILAEPEGQVTLAMPPHGLIYRMRSGGTCALLPRMEGAEVMEFLCRRFDRVFVVMPGGEVVVLERLQNRIPSLVDEATSRG